jgi:aminoglycoside phosphotransferase family enzyme
MRQQDGKSADPAEDAGEPDQAALREKVAFLSSPSAYPDDPSRVEARETHMSWVFLGDRAVYKLKKPVVLPPVDLASLGAREANCREEVRLNRRLAPQIYLGVVALMRTAEGRLQLGGGGVVVDWLVKMRRLPEERMLDRLLLTDGVDPADLEALATTLAAFYRAAERPAIEPSAYVERYLREQSRNREVLQARAFRLPGIDLEGTLGALDRALAASRGLLMERARRGHVVDAHGDLRPEHICLARPVVIFDCLEFSAELRSLDPFDELAFLGMECACLGYPNVGRDLLERVTALIGGRPSGALMAVYRAFRAVLRARLAVAHLLDPVPREPAKWEPLACRYLQLAAEALDAPQD